MADEVDLRDEVFLFSRWSLRTGVAGVGFRGGVEPLELFVDVCSGDEGAAVPEVAGEDRVVAFDRGLRERFARNGEDRDDLIVKKKIDHPRESSLCRDAADSCSTVVDLKVIGFFELAEECFIFAYRYGRSFGLDTLKVP